MFWRDQQSKMPFVDRDVECCQNDCELSERPGKECEASEKDLFHPQMRTYPLEFVDETMGWNLAETSY